MEREEENNVSIAGTEIIHRDVYVPGRRVPIRSLHRARGGRIGRGKRRVDDDLAGRLPLMEKVG